SNPQATKNLPSLVNRTMFTSALRTGNVTRVLPLVGSKMRVLPAKSHIANCLLSGENAALRMVCSWRTTKVFARVFKSQTVNSPGSSYVVVGEPAVVTKNFPSGEKFVDINFGLISASRCGALSTITALAGSSAAALEIMQVKNAKLKIMLNP